MTASRLDALAGAAAGARMLLLNSPHNPTGRVLSRAELEASAASAFCDDEQAGRTLVRFAFCKRPAVIAQAVARLSAL